MNRPESTLRLRSDSGPEWAARNQAWLAARCVVWRECIDAGTATTCPSLDGTAGFEPAAAQLARSFSLSPFETDLLLLCAGIELDTGLRAAVARAQGEDASGPLAVGYPLALALLPGAHWDAIAPGSPLRGAALLEVDTRAGLAQARLRLAERVLHAVTGVDAFDERLACVARVIEPGPADAHELALAQRIAAQAGVQTGPLVMLAHAAHDAGARRTARQVAVLALQAMGLAALWVDTSALPEDPRETAAVARHLGREVGLRGAGLVLAPEAERGLGAAALRLLAALDAPVLVLGNLAALALADLPGRTPLRFAVQAAPGASLADLPAALQGGAARALQQFRVEPAVLEQALASVAGLDAGQDGEQQLWSALREAARGGLDALAQRITSRAGFDDLVVPPFVASQLAQIVSQLRHRSLVHDDWGFGARDARGLGISALFCGESGTGKTLAAEAIANEAGLDLYRVDLSATVSKYIGETEKNLARLFDAAERSGAVLLFDEADALFGQRSEVRDSHDRYANIEVAYLLQRIETYRGLAILTTNMKASLDRAFLRRMRFVVQFPFPDLAARVQLWRRAFPRQARVDALDFDALARASLAGGNIRSVALNAAFAAAARGSAIDHAALADGLRSEFAKLDRSAPSPMPGASS